MIEFQGVEFAYSRREKTLHNISFAIESGINLGIVGESGSGKSTLFRLALGLLQPAGGAITFKERKLNFKDKALSRDYRLTVQAVFQDPYSSLDPKQRVFGILKEPLVSLGLAYGRSEDWIVGEVATALEAVGLRENSLLKYPHEFSGGERQRIAIARAIVSRPQLLLADEPVSSLDVANREIILDLLKNLQVEYGLTIAVISHDLSVIAALCDQTVVLESGRIVESGSTELLLAAPSEPYTQRLFQAIPRLPRITPS